MVDRRTYLSLLTGGVTGTLVGTGRGDARPRVGARTTAAREAHGTVPMQEAKLVASNGDGDDKFGSAIAVDGSTAIIGAPGDEDPNRPATGSAYVFEQRDGAWRQQTKLTASDGDGNDEFGQAVAVDGATAIVGAPFDEHPNGDTGSAYVFERSDGEWTQQAKLTIFADDRSEQVDSPTVADRSARPAPVDRFGSSVVIDGSMAIIGAPRDEEPNGRGAGSAYIFERTGSEWIQRAKLTATDGTDFDNFGTAVAIDGSTAIVGADSDEEPTHDGEGSVYVFERADGEWTQQAKLTPEDWDSGDGFARSVAVAGSTAVVGALLDEDPNRHEGGSAYVFERTSGEWRQQAKLAAADGDGFDWFGRSVAVAGSTAIIGAPHDEDPNGAYGGSAYVFERTGGVWRQQAKLAAADGDSSDSFGLSVAVDGSTALVGADGDEDPNGPRAGSTYVFDLGLDESDPSSPPDVTGDGHPARDPDDDGRYEDVNGDGEATPGDATVLFDSVFERDSAVVDNLPLFDFNRDGRLTPGDATVLFDEIF